jgi:AcrR family transcriptional regulator
MTDLVRGKVPKDRPGPEGGKRDTNRKERTDALLKAGVELFLELGIEQASIDDIARAAGMAKGNFYRYFDDKGALVAAILLPLAEGFRKQMKRCEKALQGSRGPDEVTSAYANLSLALGVLAQSELPAFRLYLQERRAPTTPSRAAVSDLAREIETSAIALSRFAKEHGVIDVDDPAVSALAVVGAAEQLALHRLKGELTSDDLTVVRVVVKMILDGVRGAR